MKNQKTTDINNIMQNQKQSEKKILSLEDDTVDQNPFYRGGTQNNGEFDILDPYAKVFSDIMNDNLFVKRVKSSNYKPIELMSSKQMITFCEEKHLPKPPLFCNPVVQDIFMAQNIARTHPKLFCKRVLSKLENRFEGEYYYDMKGYGIKVIEGVEALTECIDNLQHREPVMPLEWNKDLAEAAKDHVKDIGKNGLLGHESSSGLGVYDRILMNNDNQAVGMWAENIVYESMHPVEIVALMLINDGDSLRPQRENALDMAHQHVGIDFGGHVFKYVVTVIDYCKEYIDEDRMFEMKKGIYDYEKDNLEYEELE